jgi:transcriptional regulator of acetoin/glycerol metabolism
MLGRPHFRRFYLSSNHSLVECRTNTDRAQRRRLRAEPLPQSPVKDLNFVGRDRIVRVLAEERGNKRAAADRLGVSRRTLYRRLERFQ